MQSSNDILDKRSINECLTNLTDAVSRCKRTVGLDNNTIIDVFQSELFKENVRNDYEKIKKIDGVLGATPHIAMKWILYTKNRQKTRKSLLDAGFDARNFDVIDGN